MVRRGGRERPRREEKQDAMEDYVMKDHKKLRRGYTTGTCAAAAARAAAVLATGLARRVEQIEIATPGGAVLTIPIEEGRLTAGGSTADGGSCVEKGSGAGAVCAVRKDSGDDPDVTDGVLVYARVELTGGDDDRILIDGGPGVGRVTKPGLACAVGQAAINPTPRRMIEEEVRRTAAEAGYEGGIFVEISIPAGTDLARKTYNPRLGIEGGISVLGTSGIVEPMSEQALIDTIKVEMNMQKAAGAEYLLITPGNYGETFLRESMSLGSIYTVKCSNFLGEALDHAVELGFHGVLLTAHIGKLVKVAGGIMNTHSKYGDARLEILAAHAARMGAEREIVERLFSCVTTDDAIAVLDGEAREQMDGGGGTERPSMLRIKTMASILEKVEYHIGQRVGDGMAAGAVMFSNRYGLLGQTSRAACLVEKLRQDGAEGKPRT